MATLAEILEQLGGADAVWQIPYPGQKEEVEFQKTFTNTFLSWQKVEASLFLLFAVLHKREKLTLLSGAFHSVISLDGRLAMVGAVLALQFEDDDALLAEWGKLSNKVRKVSKKRNYLAHFSLHEITKRGRKEFRLRPSELDFRKSGKDYGVEEMKQFAETFSALHAELSAFILKVQPRLPRHA